MNKYEIMFIVKSDLEEEARKNADTVGWKDEILEKFATIEKAEFIVSCK